MGKLVPVLAKEFENVFPELHAQQKYVQNVVVAEERSFLNTLGQGIQLFNEMIEGTDTLSGEDAFKLHDTYGFPIDLTQLMAREQEIDVDEEGFTRLMDEQKKRAREAGKFSSSNAAVNNWHTLKDFDKDSEFVGYDSLETKVEILADKREGDRVALLLDKTPFYAESGGQIADTGILKKDGLEIKILDVQKSSGQYIHYVDHLPEDLSGSWTAKVDADRRKETEKHHTATHLMHAALREKLGKHVAQKGSLVEPNRLRFDFSHFEAVKTDELNEIEERINQKIQENIPLKEERAVPIDEAKKRGAMMLFGEKYGEEVRVITFDPNYSVELCGGTHVDATGRIGYFRFTNETSVAAGIRRVEAVVGRSADKLLREEHSLVESMKGLLGDQTDPKKSIQELLEEKKQLEKELKKLQHQKAAGRLDEILKDGQDINGIKLFTGKLDGGSMDRLKQSGYDALNKQEEESVIVLATVNEEENKVYLLAAITDDLVGKGMKAGDLVSVLGRAVGGGGGGQPNLATAGGRFPEKISDAFQAAKDWIEDQNL